MDYRQVSVLALVLSLHCVTADPPVATSHQSMVSGEGWRYSYGIVHGPEGHGYATGESYPHGYGGFGTYAPTYDHGHYGLGGHEVVSSHPIISAHPEFNSHLIPEHPVYAEHPLAAILSAHHEVPGFSVSPLPVVSVTPHPVVSVTPQHVVSVTPHPVVSVTPHHVVSVTPHPVVSVTPHEPVVPVHKPVAYDNIFSSLFGEGYKHYGLHQAAEHYLGEAHKSYGPSYGHPIVGHHAPEVYKSYELPTVHVTEGYKSYALPTTHVTGYKSYEHPVAHVSEGYKAYGLPSAEYSLPEGKSYELSYGFPGLEHANEGYKFYAQPSVSPLYSKLHESSYSTPLAYDSHLYKRSNSDAKKASPKSSVSIKSYAVSHSSQ